MAFPVDEERIEAAERALGRTLPPRLRERLRRDNGGDLLLLLAGEDEPRLRDHETGEHQPVSTDWA